MNLPVKTLLAAGILAAASAPAQSADILPLVDAHLHYSHDAWDGLPPKDAIAAIRRAGLKKAFVSSSSDKGTQMLYSAAPDLIVPMLWAHSGFAEPDGIRPMLAKHKRLWSDLTFRSSHGSGGNVDPSWAKLFAELPNHFMIGTDTYTPERWYFVEEHASRSRAWLQSLPRALAERIAWKNATDLPNWALKIKD